MRCVQDTTIGWCNINKRIRTTSFILGLIFSVVVPALSITATPSVAHAQATTAPTFLHTGDCTNADPPGSRSFRSPGWTTWQGYSIQCFGPDQTPPTDWVAYGSAVRGGKCADYAGFGYFYNFSECFGKDIAIFIATGTIWITGWFLSTAAVLFNWVAMYAIGDFATLYGWVAPAIQVVWTVFRDVANILIIGILTFVAIEMILGTQAFGGKKTIAKVLLIAILINFSLLFTRIIIQTSNFVAVAFYKAMDLKPTGSTDSSAFSTTVGDQFTLNAGIAGKFAQAMGLGGTLRTDQILRNIADNPQGGGWVALLHGLFTGAIFVAAGLVMLYLTFLLISRIIFLIFLAMMSSLAFATYIVPKSILSGYDWDAWWESLLKSAVFAPLLIMLLWATLKVGEGLTGIMPSGSSTAGAPLGAVEQSNMLAAAGGAYGVTLRGPDAIPAEGSMIATAAEAADTPLARPGRGKAMADLVVDPTSSGGLSALFGYLIILGMLIGSAKIATGFSAGIAGFNYAKMATALPLTLGDRLYGVLGRRIRGRDNAGRADEAASRAATLQQRLANLKPDQYWRRAILTNELKNTLNEKRAAEKRAARTYELGQTKLGQAAFSFLGAKKDIPGLGGYGGEVESFAARKKRIAEESAKEAAELTNLGDTAKKAIRTQAMESADVTHKLEENRLGRESDTAHATRDSAAGSLATQRRDAEDIKKQQKKFIDDAQEQLARAVTADQRGVATRAIITAQNKMQEEDEKIRNVAAALKKLDDAATTAAKSLTDHQASRKEFITKAGDEKVNAAVENLRGKDNERTKALAASFAKGWAPTNWIDPQMANAARAAVAKNSSESSEREATLNKIFQKFAAEKKK